MKYPKIIRKFSGKYDFLDNSYHFPFEYEGVWYDNAEAAFQSTRLEHRKLFSHLSGILARKFGHRFSGDKDWERDKDRIMFSVLLKKFSNPSLKKKLLDTDNALLVYGNTYHENYWGQCKCESCSTIVGKNKLGKMLIKIRHILREEQK